jgi:hypothetical protein
MHTAVLEGGNWPYQKNPADVKGIIEKAFKAQGRTEMSPSS